MTQFSRDTLLFDAKPASKVALPTSSRQKVIFLDTDNVIKTLDFSGKIETLGSEVTFTKAADETLFYSAQTQKYYRQQNGELLEVSGEGVEGNPTQVAEIYETTFELPVGPAGDKGDRGETGPQGVAGEKGDIGEKGDTGPQGIQGEKGERGPRGFDGIDGLQGIQGEKGDKGDKGDIGPAGPMGPSGAGGVSKATVVKLIQEYSPSGEVSSSYGYNIEDQLVLITSSKGTQTFSYTDGFLTGIVGTGSYNSKEFVYDAGNLVGVNII